MGVMSEDGELRMLPPMNEKLEEGTKVVLLAEACACLFEDAPAAAAAVAAAADPPRSPAPVAPLSASSLRKGLLQLLRFDLSLAPGGVVFTARCVLVPVACRSKSGCLSGRLSESRRLI